MPEQKHHSCKSYRSFTPFSFQLKPFQYGVKERAEVTLSIGSWKINPVLLFVHRQLSIHNAAVVRWMLP